ncbi:MAG: restriction endonuclease subunit S [Parabacteroides sp.]|nr:restriction endonuclease subunit S [Parabacteroides sp.]
MEKEKEIKTVVPALRFPEFQGMIGWEKTYIYEECPNPYSGGTPKTTEKKYYGGNIPFIRSAEIGKDKTELSITQEGLNSSSAKMIQKGDLLIALYGANSGDIAISKIDGAINQAILCLKAKSNNLFIYYTLLKKQKDIVSKYLQGGQGNLSGEIIKSIDFYIPQEIEQQKIANCLSSLDELIEATAQKVRALEKHKKGLMQRLFPAEGKNVPDLRFPEFQGTEEWKERQLGNIGEVITGNTPSTKDMTNYGGNKLFVSPADISSNRYVSDTKIKLTDKGFSTGRYIRANSVLFVCIGSTIGKVAQNKIECITNQQINVIVPYEEYLSDFIYSVLEHKASQIAMFAGQQAVPIINKTLFSSISILVPPQKEEQQKIADCFSSLDELIEATSRKVEILKEHKKGLMQQLFPKI